VRVCESAQLMENSRGDVAATWTAEAGAASRRMANMGRGGPKEDDSRWCHGININPYVHTQPRTDPCLRQREARRCLSGGSEPATSPMLTSYSVGRGISLPFRRLRLPWCDKCDCHASIARTHPSDPCNNWHLVLETWSSHVFRYPRLGPMVLLKGAQQYTFFSTGHEAAIRAFLA